MYFNISHEVLYLQIKLHGEYNKISNEMYKHLVEQKMQQKVYNNYVALLIKQFAFIKYVEFLC